MTYLIFGGSASGKSMVAETLACKFSAPRIYIATMRPWGDECHNRIEKHRAQREGKGFETIENYGDMTDVTLPPHAAVLLECMGNMTANVQFDPATAEPVSEVLSRGVDYLAGKAEHLIVVSNDVFLEQLPTDCETVHYLDHLGGVNRHMATTFDAVVEVVCGIPIFHKGDFNHV